MEEKQIHECQCDGPGHCPVYNVHMDQSRYHKCKNDASWRKHYRDFFSSLHGSEVQMVVEEKMAKISLEVDRMRHIEQQLQIIANEEKEAIRQKFKAYYRQEYKKITEGFLASLSPEELEIYQDIKADLEQKNEEQRKAQQQLDIVVDKLKEEGIDLEQDSQTEGMGDAIHGVLSKLGITEDTINKWSGLKEGCGCGKRQKFLNKILPFNKNKE